jgi:hypothetical protein
MQSIQIDAEVCDNERAEKKFQLDLLVDRVEMFSYHTACEISLEAALVHEAVKESIRDFFSMDPDPEKFISVDGLWWRVYPMSHLERRMPYLTSGQIQRGFIDLFRSNQILLNFAPDSIKFTIPGMTSESRAQYIAQRSAARTSPSIRKVTAVKGVVYLVKGGGHYKIGVTKQGPKQRTKEIALHMPFPVECIHTITSNDIYRLEKFWHNKFAAERANGEWFDLSDAQVSDFCQYTEDHL